MSTLHSSPALLPFSVLAPSIGRPALQRLARLIAIAGAHLLLAWALLQSQGVRQVLHQAQPLMVALLAEAHPAPPAPPLPAPAPAKPLPAPAWLPPPEITVAAAPPAPPPAPVRVAPGVVPVQAPTQAPTQASTQASTHAPPPVAAVVAAPAPALRAPAPPAPVAAPAEPRTVGAGAIRYRLPPAIEVPMASRRLGESGTVLLRVVVDVNGLPRQISLHRSSGFARLDEQALAAMRSARFQPLVEGGSAVEWLVIAPLQYDVD